MNSEEQILRELEEILYGQMRIELIHEKMQQEGTEDFEPFWDYPDDPESFLKKKSTFFGKEFTSDEHVEHTQWGEAYYHPISDLEDDKHVLLRFYRIYTECERDRLIHKLQYLVNHLETTLLKYTMIEVHTGILEMLKDLKKSIILPKMGYANNLRDRVLQLVIDEMVACLLELELRFGHLLNGNTVGYERLFIQKLNTILPEKPAIYLTRHGARFMLQKMMVDQSDLKAIEAELKRQYQVISASAITKRADLLQAIDALESAWIFGNLCLQINEEHFHIKQSLAEAEEEIKKLNKALIENEAASEIVTAVLEMQQVGQIPWLFKYSDHTNAARMLIGLDSTESPQKRETDGTQKRKVRGVGSLAYYNRLDEVAAELDLNRKTLLKYLRKAGIKGAHLSRKTDFIHDKEIEKFMEYYTKEYTDD